MPAVRAHLMHCPACRDTRAVREVGEATVKGCACRLVQCVDKSCELIWVTRVTVPASRARAA